MAIDFDIFKTCDGYKSLVNDSYNQMLENIEKDSNFDPPKLCEEFKIDFFNNLEKYDNSTPISTYCNEFFIQPKSEKLEKKKYLLKGKEAPAKIHACNLGRVMSKNGIKMCVQDALDEKTYRDSGIIQTTVFGDDFINSFIQEYGKSSFTPIASFIKYINDRNLLNEDVGDRPMWSFENTLDPKPFNNYNLTDLPCILGLPDNNGKSDNYKIDRANDYYCAYEIKTNNDVAVKHPNSFDAGVNVMWRPGGKTKTHSDCNGKYGEWGFNEFIHYPVKFKNIKSELYKI